MSTLSDVLKLAAETIRENPERWTTGTLFRAADGSIRHYSRNACQACAEGMVYLAAETLEVPIRTSEVDDLSFSVVGHSIWYLNDVYDKGPHGMADHLDRMAAAA